jgi:hypothetical protein
MTPAPMPDTFASRKMRVDTIMRELASRHEAKVASAPASGFAAVGNFLAARRSAAIEAAIRRAAERN